MLKAIEGVIDQNGKLRLLEDVELPKSRRVVIIILNEEPDEALIQTALLSEPALAWDWERPEEDEAWSHLAQLPSL